MRSRPKRLLGYNETGTRPKTGCCRLRRVPKSLATIQTGTIAERIGGWEGASMALRGCRQAADGLGTPVLAAVAPRPSRSVALRRAAKANAPGTAQLFHGARCSCDPAYAGSGSRGC